jgi:oxygen-independent coproporphyrinogen III oxidase
LKKTGLYIHFPFCRRACFYCHFFKKKHSPARAAAYLEQLEREIRLRGDPDLPVDTLYIGGGSPSLLTAAQLQNLLGVARRNFRLAAAAEITLEANPEDVSAQRLREYRAAGVNRLSLGVQSFQESDLRFLRRTHSADQAVRAVELALEVGFANLSLDLIIGLESQTSRSMDLNFRLIEKLNPTHVSVYILEGVPRTEADDKDARLYFQARRSLLGLGYDHYEVSNFCRPHKASRHNLKYWRNESYVGLGPSAAGFLEGTDYRNYSDLKKYGAAVESGRLPQMKTRQLDPAKRRIITGLRLLDGIPASAFNLFSSATDFLLKEGFLIRRGRNLAVPPEKILLLNEILGYFI